MKSATLLLLATVVLGGCKATDIGDPFKIDLGPAPVLTLVSGDGQVVPLGAEAIVRVKLVSAAGVPMTGSSVRFHWIETVPNVVSGGGFSSFRQTDADGIAELRFTTAYVGPFTVTADIVECTTFGFKGCPDDKVVVRAKATAKGTITPAP